MSDYDRRLAKKLRGALLVTESQMSDEQVLKIGKDTLMEARALVSICKEDLAEIWRPAVDAALSAFLWISRRVQR